MSKDTILTVIKNRDKESILTMLSNEGKIKTLSYFAEVLDNRAYFTVNGEGEIKRKDINLTLPVFAFSDNNEQLADTILELADLKERSKISAVSRLSNLEIKKLKENLFKTIINGNLDFSKKFGKELFLRDRDEFFKTITSAALMGNMNSLKPLMVLGFKKLMENKKYDENIFYLVIAFLTKYRDEFFYYERACGKCECTLEELRKSILENETLLKSREGLEVLTYLKAVETLDSEKRNRFLLKIKTELGAVKNMTPLNKIEEYLLSIFL